MRLVSTFDPATSSVTRRDTSNVEVESAVSDWERGIEVTVRLPVASAGRADVGRSWPETGGMETVAVRTVRRIAMCGLASI